MIYSMITGDMLTFGIIYTIVLFGFSQSFYFLYKGFPNQKNSLYSSYTTTWMGLFQITLGNYDVNRNPNLIQNKSFNLFIVSRTFFNNVSISKQISFCNFYGFCTNSSSEHVNRYDGQYLRSCNRTE